MHVDLGLTQRRLPTLAATRNLFSNHSMTVFRSWVLQTSAQVAPEEAVRQLQTMLPPPPKRAPEPVVLDNVAPGLLLPPAGRGIVGAALAGGTFELGDRVACLRGTGMPALGARGTVVGRILPCRPTNLDVLSTSPIFRSVLFFPADYQGEVIILLCFVFIHKSCECELNIFYYSHELV